MSLRHTNHVTCWIQAAFFGLSLFIAGSASAITLLEDNRRVTNSTDDGTTIVTPPVSFTDWETASHFSTFTDDRWLGLGSGSGESALSFSVTESLFDVTFTVAQATLLNLQGSLSGEDGTFGFGEAAVRLFARAPTNDIVLFSESASSGNFVPYSFVTLLEPGAYRLLLNTNITPGGFGTFAEWSFVADFEAQPVPIPAMGWLMALLLIALRQYSLQSRK